MAERANGLSAVLPPRPALVMLDGLVRRLALWTGVRLALPARVADELPDLDSLLAMPLAEARERIDAAFTADLAEVDVADSRFAAPTMSQEVWAAGVTYHRSREARVEEATEKDIYTRVYSAERPELFFKCAGWRVVPHQGMIGVRSDSSWDVPEPELAVLTNARAEVFGYACGNDMSSRSIEGENPLYLPQAKVYEDSCSLGPAIALGWHTNLTGAAIKLQIERDRAIAFEGSTRLSEMVRDPSAMARVLHSVYPLTAGGWLLTGTSIVPPPSYTARPGDVIRIAIDGVGQLANTVRVIRHSGATAPPRSHISTEGVARPDTSLS